MGEAGRGNNPKGNAAGARVPLLRRRLVARRLSLKNANVCRFVILLPLGIVAVLAIVAHAVLPQVALRSLSDSINADVTAESVEVGPSRVVLNGVTVRSRSTAGRAGELLRIERLDATVNPARLLSGAGAITALSLQQPTLRVSINEDAAANLRTNLAGLRLPSTGGDGSSGAPVLPAIEVISGQIDWGEHRGDRFRRLRLLPVDGMLTPSPDPDDPDTDDPGLTLDLREIVTPTARGGDADKPGLALTGRLDAEELRVTLRNVDFDRLLSDAAPTSIAPLLADLDVRGLVPEVTISLSGEGYGTIEARAQLAEAEMTIPIAAAAAADDGTLPGFEGAAEGLRLERTSGELLIEQRQVIANVNGELAGVAYAVAFDADVGDLLEGRGLEAQTPYSATVTVDRFAFGENSDFLPFLPPDVRSVLARFADQNQIGAISPTAEVSAEIRLAGQISASDGGFGSAVPQTYRGFITIAGGATAFREFPYQFEDVRGEIEIDQDQMIIRYLSGRAPSGAELSANGRVSPLGDAAGFDLEVEVFGVPIDDAFRAATPPEHAPGLDEIFNQQQHAELIAHGLIVPPGQREAAQATLRAARRSLTSLADAGDEAARATIEAVARTAQRLRTAPEVEMGGTLGLVLRLQKPPGGDGVWDIRINADVADAVLVPRMFPLPIRVRDLAVLIDDDRITVTRGAAAPINGLAGLIEGTIDIAGDKPRPDLVFLAERLRADDLLLHAIGPDAGDPARRDAAEVVRRLGLHGDTDVQGVIRSSQGRSEFEIEMSLDRVSMLTGPIADRPPLLIGDATGLLVVRHDGLTIDTDATAKGITGDAGLDEPTSVQIAVELDWSDPEAGTETRTLVGAQAVRATAPIEQILQVFGPDAAEGYIGFLEAFEPLGLADAEIAVSTTGDETSVRADVRGLRDASVARFGQRISVDDPAGVVTVRSDRAGRMLLEVSDASGSLRVGDDPAGDFVADGTMFLTEPDGAPRPPHELRVSHTGGRFESTLARSFVAEEIGGVFAENYRTHDARGVFDLDVLIEPRVTVPDASTEGRLEHISDPVFTLRPRWGEITRGEHDIRVDITEGAIVSVPNRTRFDRLRGDGPGFSGSLSGSIAADGRGGSSLDATIDMTAAQLTPALRALLVEELRTNLDTLDAKVEGPLSLSGGRLRVDSSGPRDEPLVDLSFDGLLTFENASMVAGAPIDRVAGSARVSSSRGHADPAPDITILARADRARLSGIELVNAGVRVETRADKPGRIAVPVFSAAGRRGGHAQGRSVVIPDPQGGAPRYQIDASFSGFNLAALQDEIDASKLQLPGADALPSARPDSGAVVTGQARLGGLVQQDETRRGRLSLRVSGGELWRVPLLSRVIEIKALQLPTGEPLDFATADLVVDGNTITTEYVSMLSRTFEVFGYGTITLPDFGLDLVLHTRGTQPWPLISRFTDTLFDEFSSVSIRGTPGDPATTLLAFPSGRRLLGGILSAGGDADLGRLDQIARRAWRIREMREGYRPTDRPTNPTSVSGRAPERSNERDADKVARLQEQE
ncbi:MAG: hypothetical protein AAFR96_01360 [Planctomycetota bacterium]